MDKLKSIDNHITYTNLSSANNKIDFLNNVEIKDDYIKYIYSFYYLIFIKYK